MAKKTYTIFDSSASPQVGGDSVGAGDGLGKWMRVKNARILGKNAVAGGGIEQNIEEELLHFVLSGTPNGSTIKLVTANEVTSPMVYGNALQTQDAGTMVATSTTITGSFTSALPKGVIFTLLVSGSGSPIPAWTATVSGEIEEV